MCSKVENVCQSLEELEIIENVLKTSSSERELKKSLRSLISSKSNFQMNETLLDVINTNKDYSTVDIIANASLALCSSNDVQFLRNLFNSNEGALTKTGKVGIALGIVTFCDEMLFEVGKFLLQTDVGSHEKQTLLIARSLEKVSKKLSSIQNGESLTKDLEFFIFSNLSCHIDFVKTLTRSILQNLVIYYYENWKDKFLTLVGNIMEKPDHLKWLSLVCVVRCEVDFEVSTDLPTTLLSLAGIFRNSAAEIYAYFLERKLGTENFEKIWIQPLFSKQNVVDSNYRMKNDIINRLTKSQSLVLAYKEKNHFESELVTHSDHQMRLEFFQSISQSRKTSEFIADFSDYKNILKFNAVNQCPAFRQNFSSIFNKFARRLNDGYNSLRRQNLDRSHYDEFVEWLYAFLLEGLSIGSSFARRIISLNCLVSLSLYFKREFTGMDYIHWLHDTYEINKSLAVVVLSRFNFQSNDCETLKCEALKFLDSVRPPDSVTGKYILKLLINVANLDKMTLVAELFQRLRANFNSMTDLMQVSCEKPFYGYINAIRNIIHDPDSQFIKEIVKFCFELDATLFPVLGHSSPEGFLLDFENTTARSMKAQKLLVCCWRSMKESTLLLAELVEKSIDKMDFKLVNEIGEHLLYLLQNLMHRGVFEQVFVGFRLMAESLNKSSDEKLKNLPNVWLETTLSQEMLALKTTTRRSAGVPFIFQALLNAHSIVEWFPRLVKQSSTSDEDNIIIAIHSINIIRSLFSDANFSNNVMPFVPEGLQVAFQALNSSDWTVRNSGLMLFGGILRRTFGPKLNLMSSDMFFKKFPSMRDYLLKELIKITNDLNRFSTFHVLLLISCFNNEKCSDMSDYTQLIRKCAASRDSQVRLISARALLPIIPNSGKEEFVQHNYDIIVDSFHLSNNYLHGLLLQCLHLTNKKHDRFDRVIEKAREAHYEVLYEIIAKTGDRENFFKLNEKTIFDNSAGSYNLKVKYARASLLFQNDFLNSERVIFYEYLNHVIENSVQIDVDQLKMRYLKEEFLTGDDLEVLYLKFFLKNSIFEELLLKKIERLVFHRVGICFPFAVKIINSNCFAIKNVEKFIRTLVKNLEGDEEVRLAIAQSLPLIKDISKFPSDKVKCFYWLCLLTLSQDDELPIRQTIIDKNYGSVCDSKGTELIMSDFCDAIKHYVIPGTLTLLGLLLRDNFLFGFGEDDEDEKLFGKSEMNMYFESVNLCKLFLKFFKQNLNVDEKVGSEDCEIFKIASGVEDFSFSTLRDIIETFPCGSQESVAVLKCVQSVLL